MQLQGKQIVVGITGGIAAYKSAELTRRLRELGAEVQVVMTEAATRFVGPLTFQALSGRPVRTDLWDPQGEAAMGHIELARWANIILVAPASADFLARLSHGHASDLLTTLCLATKAPIAVAPAMNHVMWANPATQDNCATLRGRAISILGPATGEQACGETGEGRMLEPAELVQRLEEMLNDDVLAGLCVLVTAGPTREPIDPVRFISNRSSGKMGFALAQAAALAGARVTLVSGPVNLPTPPGVHRIDVETAAEMYQAVENELDSTHIFIANAAVADYRPEVTKPEKIKKRDTHMQLTLCKTADIVGEAASHKPRPFILGFAAETENLETHALAKLRSKGLDMIAANEVGRPDRGFESDQNAVEVFWSGGRRSLPEASKETLARQLIQLLAKHYARQGHDVIPLCAAQRGTQDP